MTRAATALLAAFVLAGPALAQTPQAPSTPPRVLEDGSTEVSELVIIARRPGRDPSQATTACLWEALPEDQRQALNAGAEQAVRTLARHDDLPLSNPALTNPAVSAALKECGGSQEPEALPFARIALFAFAAENATARALGAHRIYEARLDRAWAALSPVEKEALLVASTAINQEKKPEDEVDDAFVPAVFKLLRIVRPVGVWNPLSYRNGTVTHRVVYFYEGRSLRAAMERRF
jgi:hypothetical protein